MGISVDVAWKSLNKHHEELCGDKVEAVSYTHLDVYKRQEYRRDHMGCHIILCRIQLCGQDQSRDLSLIHI